MGRDGGPLTSHPKGGIVWYVEIPKPIIFDPTKPFYEGETPPWDVPPLGGVGFVPKAVSHPYKDTRGRYRTKSLFKEWETHAYPAHYTLGPEDDGKYASLRKRYLEIADPTEYEFARSCLAGWDHHQLLLRNCKWYREYIEEWRVELETILKSENIKRIRKIASKDGPSQLLATKYLIEQGWKSKEPKRGRPTKSEVQGQLIKEARDARLLEDDATRIGVS